MIAFFLFIFQFVSFLCFVCALPALIGFVAGGPRGLIIGVLGAIAIVVLDSLRVQSIFVKVLKPTSVFLHGKKVYRIEDASSHLFVTQGPWMPSRIWITRGAFSLLSQAELYTLVVQARKTQPFFKLSFESYLTTLILRLEKCLPESIRAMGYRAVGVSHAVPVFDVIRSLPSIGLMSVLGVFYGRTPSRTNPTPSVRAALGVLERESKICTPQLSPSLANHALIAPWPHALIRFGRSCLS